MKAREIAYMALLRMMRNGSFSNLTLDAVLREENPSPQDRQLAATLFYGVLERKLTLDYMISRYIKKKISSLDPEVLIALEMGFYQLAYLSGIPQSASVNESVNLIKKSRKRSAAGFGNAILRNFQRDQCKLNLPEGDDFYRLSIETGMPQSILHRWARDYSFETAAALARACLGRPPLHLRVNPLRATVEEAVNALSAEGVEVHPDSLIPNCLEVFHSGAIAEKTAFRHGMVSVQDTASQLCALALDAQPGEKIYDLCAAPGSKSFVLAQEMKNQGELFAFDLYPARVRLIQEGAERLGISCLHAAAGDASQYNSALGLADRVLCDVPCSGLGVIRRKPEIRWKTEAELDALPPIQRDILSNAARYVKSGGILVYSTCSLSRAENEAVVEDFLDKNPDYTIAPMPPVVAGILGNDVGQATLMPVGESRFDGFYIARMLRR
ncbi:MAG: 16S rRNA (cytosine(967)-C(5))-methyltransferase RsmB [Candidatus Merdivicinus sp.]|jgi:16S rRNA (cytosine967-C5)-methyltransferase